MNPSVEARQYLCVNYYRVLKYLKMFTNDVTKGTKLKKKQLSHTLARDGETLRMRLHTHTHARDGEGLGMRLHTHTH